MVAPMAGDGRRLALLALLLLLSACGPGAQGVPTGTGGATGHLTCAFQTDGAVLKACNPHLPSDCETNVLSDVDNCGDCNRPCPRPPSTVDDQGNAIATAWCNNGTCSLACASNHADCNQAVNDGCEVDLGNDPSNCGACGHVCSGTDGHGMAICTDGICGLSCDVGFADCNWVADDGCETSLPSDPTNCGACGNSCSSEGGTASCDEGICQISCSPDRADCNVDASDGCETALTTDAKNCGGCGTACAAGTCNSGSCS